MKKTSNYSVKDNLLRELMEAKEELDRVRTLFDYAEDEYFEIVNTELTVAITHYNLCFTKIKKFYEENNEVPMFDRFVYISEKN